MQICGIMRLDIKFLTFLNNNPQLNCNPLSSLVTKSVFPESTFAIQGNSAGGSIIKITL